MPRVSIVVLPALAVLVAVGVPRGAVPLPTVARASRPVEVARASYVAGVDSLAAAVAALGQVSSSREASAQAAFRRVRRAYKRVEYLAVALLPEAELTVNGPPLPRPHELVVGATVPPTGLQVIEAALFPHPSPGADNLIRRQIRLIDPTVRSLRAARLDPATADARFLDAARQELARITTLGLAGFDATVTRDGVQESAEALRGLRLGLAAYRSADSASVRDARDRLDARLADAIAALEQHPAFDTFDRLGFLTGHARPVATALSELQVALAVPRLGRPTSWAATTSSIFDSAAIDPLDYAPSDAAPLRPDIIALGRALFFDTRLSAGNRRSCATCHQSARGFSDGRRTAAVDPGPGTVRNTPTLLNAALQPFQFADQRSRTLEDQIAAVLANPREMHLPLDAAAARLRGDRAMVQAFVAAYAVPAADAVSARRLQTTLAAFVRSLVAVRSRYDRAVAGDTAVLTPEERRGFNLFMGKAACGTCHFAPTLGGSMPPDLLESEPEVIGVPSRAVTSGATIDPDPGVAGFDHAPIHRHAFKTPSLRNVALTAPYMHNGVYRTLEQVVDFYDRGGGAGIGIALPNQTLSPEPLHLRGQEKRELTAFMRALTDTAGHH